MRLKGLMTTAAALALGAAVSFGGQAAAAGCGTAGTITVANMPWVSASTMASLTRDILVKGYGCKVDLVPGNTLPTATTMLLKGQPDIAPQLWTSTIQSVWDKILKKGQYYKANDVFSKGGLEGWWIPKYVAKAHPGLTSITDLNKYWKLFTSPVHPDTARVYIGPPGWGSTVISKNLFAALGLGKHFKLFSAGSGANLEASIARKVALKQPIVAYYYSPSYVIAKYNLVRLKMPAYSPAAFDCLPKADCAHPKVTGWKPGQVALAANDRLKTAAPAVAAFLGHMQVPNHVMNVVSLWANNNEASGNQAATYFLKHYKTVWHLWVPAAVAKKIDASLG